MLILPLLACCCSGLVTCFICQRRRGKLPPCCQDCCCGDAADDSARNHRKSTYQPIKDDVPPSVGALDSLIREADAGIADAQYQLGVLYANGEGGVPQSLDVAVAYFQRAALQAHADARYALARCYAIGAGIPANESLAAQLFALAAAQGHTGAQRELIALQERAAMAPYSSSSSVERRATTSRHY